MKVKDLMSTNITCARENTPVSQIAAHMKKDNVGSIPVCDDAGHIKGIVTDRDIVLRVMAISADAVSDSGKTRSLSDMTSKDIMTADPVTVSPDTDIHHAALMFSSYQIRRLPVVEASKLVGMLSLGDVASKPVYIDEAGDCLSAISLTGGLQAKS